MSSTMTVAEERYQVFLGGSCGGRKSPTTWRQEVAIPLLQQNQVKFFNPQVDTWSHDLIHKENSAKDNSDWLLFVLEASTRGISSMVEVAHLVGSRRPVVFVLQKEREAGNIDIPDDCVSSLEVDDIRRSQALLHTIIGKEQCSKYCSVLKDGVQHVINALKQQPNCTASGRSCSAAATSRDKRRRLHIREIVNMLASFSHKAAHQKSAKPDRLPRPLLTLKIGQPVSAVQQPPSSWRNQTQGLAIIGADGIDNIASLAEERLRHHGVATPVVRVQKDAALDLQALSESCVLLAFVPGNALSCTTMCKTAYMLAKHRAMVVCVQDLSTNSCNSSFTGGALSDYNRGRAYLRDIAARSGAVVASDFEQALEAACHRAAILAKADVANNNGTALSPSAGSSAGSPTDVRESFFGGHGGSSASGSSAAGRKIGSNRKASSSRSTSSGHSSCPPGGRHSSVAAATSPAVPPSSASCPLFD